MTWCENWLETNVYMNVSSFGRVLMNPSDSIWRFWSKDDMLIHSGFFFSGYKNAICYFGELYNISKTGLLDKLHALEYTCNWFYKRVLFDPSSIIRFIDDSDPFNWLCAEGRGASALSLLICTLFIISLTKWTPNWRK